MAELPPLFYWVAVPGVLLTGISKSGFGGGMGVLAVPILALIMSPIHAAAIMLPILCLMDLFSVWAFRGQWDPINMRIIVPAGLVGIVLGTATFRYMEADFIRILLGAISLLFSLNYWLRPKLNTAAKPNRLLGTLWGTTAGFTSFIAHSGGPPLSVYLLPQQLPRTTFVATTVLFFIIINYVKLIPYGFLGQLNFDNLLVSAYLAPLAPVGVWMGVVLHKRLSDVLFYQICYGLLFITGIKLLYDGIGNLLA